MAKALHGVYLAWTKRFISYNAWRIEGDFDDCLQEAQIKFVQCQNKYGNVEAPHLMSLFQRSLVRHFHTLSNKRSTYTGIKEKTASSNGSYLHESCGIGDKIPIEMLDLQRKLWSFLTQVEYLVMGIKQELCEATGYTGDDSTALLNAADKMPDEVFEKLSKAAQDWLDKAIIASNNEKPLPPLTVEAKKSKKSSPSSSKDGSGTKNAVGRRSKFPETATIELLITANPKRKNTRAHKIFSLYENGSTVKEFLDAGGQRRDLNWDSEKKFIRVVV